MNIDEINGLLQQDDNDDILFDTIEDEDFRGFSFKMDHHQMLIMNVWEVNQGGIKCEELAIIIIILFLLLAFFESSEIGGSELVA